MVDSIRVPDPNGGWLAIDGIAHSIQRDITLHKCIRRLWASVAEVNTPTLGGDNNYFSSDPNVIQAHPANEDFTNVGEIGMVFRKGAYYQDPANRDERIGYGTNKTEKEVRLNLADPNFQQIFNYLTVFDPAVYSWNDPNEARIKGRININTAPWYVIAQLPWVTDPDPALAPDDPNRYNLARAIVAHRDEVEGFRSIGELMNVNGMDRYVDGDDLNSFPDLTMPDSSLGDGAVDDFEERDLIFARISNLVTVRSDVFTAYILVRIGTDGPQKRVIAILDRSDVYSSDDGGIKVRAVHPVADPR
ncbi:hypothetical protein ES703_100593 [subsurface metagenome]